MEKSNETIFKDAIEESGYSTLSYSGRGMYGKSCLGFETSRSQSPIQATAEIIFSLSETCQYSGDEIELSEFVDFFSDVRQDSMGLGTIIYFPEISWEADWNESEIEDEESDE